MKILASILAAAALIIVVAYALTTSRVPVEDIDALPTDEPVSTVSTGTIEGKLCYPSEFLPAGAIEAKDTINQTVVSQSYGGTEAGEGNTYSLAVPAGNYILRYMTENDLAGYHTDVCPTGGETTCNSENQREHIGVVLTANQTVTGISLCDFYYNEETEPDF